LVPHRFGVYVELRERREMDTNTEFDNSNIRIEAGTPAVSYHQVIRHLNPAAIPPVTAITNMGWCGGAAYDISFFGVNGFPENYMGEIGTAIHRIVIKSVLEIVQSIKQSKNNIPTQDAKQISDSIATLNPQKRMDHSQEGYQLSAGVGEWYIILYSLLT
jgi:hypothetical protein